MKAYVLDTSALLTLRSDESGAKQVAELLAEAASGDAVCYGSFITLMEVLIGSGKTKGKLTVGRLISYVSACLSSGCMSPANYCNRRRK